MSCKRVDRVRRVAERELARHVSDLRHGLRGHAAGDGIVQADDGEVVVRGGEPERPVDEHLHADLGQRVRDPLRPGPEVVVAEHRHLQRGRHVRPRAASARPPGRAARRGTRSRRRARARRAVPRPAGRTRCRALGGRGRPDVQVGDERDAQGRPARRRAPGRGPARGGARASGPGRVPRASPAMPPKYSRRITCSAT